MSSAPKQPDQDSAALDLGIELPNAGPGDREQKLSSGFEDPSMEELLPGDPPSPLSLVEETAEAVQELVEGLAPPAPEAPGSEALQLAAQFSFSSATESEPVEHTINFEIPGELGELPMPEAPGEEVGRAAPPPASPSPAAAASSEQSLLLALPSDSVEEPAQLLELRADAGGAELYASASRSAGLSEKLFELVACQKPFEAVVQESLAAMMEAVRAEAGSVLELDFVKEDFFFRAAIGGANPTEQLKAFRVPCGKGIVGHVAEHREPVLLRDLEEDRLQMRAISMSVGFEARTCMAVPVIVADQIFGVIEVFNRSDGKYFDESDLSTLQSGVRLFAKVLEVRFLMAELLRRAAG